jgi:hypothetical protein
MAKVVTMPKQIFFIDTSLICTSCCCLVAAKLSEVADKLVWVVVAVVEAVDSWPLDY